MAHPALAYLKDGYDPEAPLRINRLHGEAYIRCPNCPEVKVYLSRLPWQTRCIHCISHGPLSMLLSTVLRWFP